MGAHIKSLPPKQKVKLFSDFPSWMKAQPRGYVAFLSRISGVTISILHRLAAGGVCKMSTAEHIRKVLLQEFSVEIPLRALCIRDEHRQAVHLSRMEKARKGAARDACKTGEGAHVSHVEELS